MTHNTPTDRDIIIEEKIEVIRDFCLLGRRTKTADRRAEDIRKILACCKTEREIECKLYDLLHGNITTDEWIEREKNYA